MSINLRNKNLHEINETTVTAYQTLDLKPKDLKNKNLHEINETTVTAYQTLDLKP